MALIRLTKTLNATNGYLVGRILDWSRATITGVTQQRGGERDWFEFVVDSPEPSAAAIASERAKRKPREAVVG